MEGRVWERGGKREGWREGCGREEVRGRGVGGMGGRDGGKGVGERG